MAPGELVVFIFYFVFCFCFILFLSYGLFSVVYFLSLLCIDVLVALFPRR